MRSSYSAEVRAVEIDDREIVLVGTAHISRTSVELVREVIEGERPDAVCLELDAQRYEALSRKKQWEELDLKQIIRNRQLGTLLLNLLLSAYQRRLGLGLGVQPGSELIEAARIATELEIPVVLCDREVRVTLRRVSRRTSFFRKALLGSELMLNLFASPEISEEEIQELKKQDVLNELLAELGRQLPVVKEVVIDERDAYLAEKIRDANGQRLVAVVGAGHIDGLEKRLLSDERANLDELDTIPAVSPVWRIVGWAVPAIILGALAWIGATKGVAAAGDNLLFWILANGIPAAIGAILAYGHPLTIASAFVSAPIASLTPVIGTAYITAFVQVIARPPVVKEFQAVADDVSSFGMWWRNKLLRVFLTFLLPGLGSMLGTWIGGARILTSLF